MDEYLILWVTNTFKYISDQLIKDCFVLPHCETRNDCGIKIVLFM